MHDHKHAFQTLELTKTYLKTCSQYILKQNKNIHKQKYKMLTEKFEREEHILIIDEEYMTENTRTRVQIHPSV